MSDASKTKGNVNISDNALEQLVGYSATQVYGVVGMASPSLKDRIVHLARRDFKKGVEVTCEDGRATINVYIIVEHGVNIQEVARNLQQQVTYDVQSHTGLTVAGVNVFVKGIKT